MSENIGNLQESLSGLNKVAKKKNATVKLEFNFDTALTYPTRIAKVYGAEMEVQNEVAMDIAKAGEIREVPESMVEQFLSDMIYLPVGQGESLQRMTLKDFIPDKYTPRAKLVS